MRPRPPIGRLRPIGNSFMYVIPFLKIYRLGHVPAAVACRPRGADVSPKFAQGARPLAV